MKKIILPALMILAAATLWCDASKAFFFGHPLVGEKAPEFALHSTQSDDPVSMEERRDGKRAIVFFWAVWCPTCNGHLKTLESIQDDLKSKDIELFSVSIDGAVDQIKTYAKDHKLSYEIFVDSQEELHQPYAIIGVPMFVFINEEGVVDDVLFDLPEEVEEVFS